MRLSASRDTSSSRRPVLIRSTGAAASVESQNANMRDWIQARPGTRSAAARTSASSTDGSSSRGCGAMAS